MASGCTSKQNAAVTTLRELAKSMAELSFPVTCSGGGVHLQLSFAALVWLWIYLCLSSFCSPAALVLPVCKSEANSLVCCLFIYCRSTALSFGQAAIASCSRYRQGWEKQRPPAETQSFSPCFCPRPDLGFCFCLFRRLPFASSISLLPPLYLPALEPGVIALRLCSLGQLPL
jgi:hypothetical protein